MRESFGATHFLNAEALGDNLVKDLFALTGGGADYSFECIGNIHVMRQAFDSTNPYWGKTIIVGIAGHDHQLALNPVAFMTGRSIRGGLFGGAKGRTDVPKVVDWYMNGDINIADLVTHRLRLEDINEGFELMRRGESIRSVILF
ncbi:MAG: zinc-binding dehydrogenase [Rhizomicrobium sp.]